MHRIAGFFNIAFGRNRLEMALIASKRNCPLSWNGSIYLLHSNIIHKIICHFRAKLKRSTVFYIDRRISKRFNGSTSLTNSTFILLWYQFIYRVSVRVTSRSLNIVWKQLPEILLKWRRSPFLNYRLKCGDSLSLSLFIHVWTLQRW